jgi:hypothetical protein
MDILQNDIERAEKHTLARLKARYIEGSLLSCPKCRRKGNFNSIILITLDFIIYKKRFLVCGWCKTITEEKENF